MKNSTLLKTSCLGAAMALAATVPAQTAVRKAGSKALVPLRVVTPIRSHAGITKSGKAVAGISKLTPKRAESQQSEIINEDFSNFTSGSLSDPDTLNWVANTWKRYKQRHCLVDDSAVGMDWQFRGSGRWRCRAACTGCGLSDVGFHRYSGSGLFGFGDGDLPRQTVARI